LLLREFFPCPSRPASNVAKWRKARAVMVSAPHAVLAPRLMLCANTAEELMTPNPVSVRSDATVPELVVLLTDNGLAAAPVIDEAGQPLGVVSRADVLTHDRETASVPAYYTEGATAARTGSAAREGEGVVRVRDIMTPVLFSVRPDTPAPRVVEEMLAM